MPDDEMRLALAYVRSEILGYLATQPRACDTVDGIVHWWIFDQRKRVGRAVVEQALNQLVAAGSVRRVNSAGVTLYRAAAQPSNP